MGSSKLNRIATYLITLYQRFISPHKGFRCAASAYYGTATCSQAVKQIILEDGLVGGRKRVREQFFLCSSAARLIQQEKKRKPKDRRGGSDSAWCLAEAGCAACSFW